MEKQNKSAGKRTGKSLLFLAMLFLIFISHAVLFIASKKEMPAWDESWHAMISLSMYRETSHKGYVTESIARFPVLGFAYNYYPHFFHYAAFPFYLLFGTGYDSALMSNLLFLLVLIISSFFIGKKLFGHMQGIILAILVTTIPVYLSLMKLYLIDFALFALVSLGYMLLLYSENFAMSRYTVFFWIVAALGTLTKWTFMLYLLVPIMQSVIGFYGIKKKNFIPLLFSLLFFLLIVLTWYNPLNLKEFLPQIIGNIAIGKLENDPSGINIGNFFFYPLKTIFDFSVVYSLMFLASIFFLRKTKGLIYNILFIYFLFTFIQNKDIRYFAPAFLFMSINIIEMYSVQNIKWQKSILALVLVAAVFNLYSQNALRDSINIDNILGTINEEAWVCVISETRTFNDVNTAYFALLNNPKIRYLIGNGCNPLDFNYVVLGPIENSWRKDLFLNSRMILEKNIDKYELVHKEGNISVLKKKP